MAITASDVAKLRAQTGAGILDCKKALEETNGDFETAIDLLRKRGITKAAKRADKVAAEGTVISYIHGAGRIGVLVEVNCETDFVARTDSFKNLAMDIAMHIAAVAPKYLSREEVSVEELEREKAVYRDQLANEGKPAEMLEKIVEGKLAKFYAEICLLEQIFIKDETKTIEGLLNEKVGEIGEKITIRRFARYELGEGIEKPVVDFVAEVGNELNK
ncbi:MAG: elongation factor Ts [Candidatus Magasanikbacteria bacterium RIFCSPHIGHO2_01_FULL_41_23]|uniref:Elongation factor Ts n=1 Tax=Candidatus Magasanikbacteria bacterium RIFCSPLOWO2_01_FULL_40_15 TaxID=1798686 RepID=A0A1F6N594_9BACT|nr:MAG: elongation factor Ts [Candidatus Magasanikbacteria bacterium RIFCSPHIGHO2_01_FULL_41_23]OGH66763.1 MAG: elongation factor Ts [Candidatus Magasanikbacteria bacterium RIFCSPHIGHO2_02_FULL_41_35]OGH74561.1 MAG: elongation factor Ts [Candidatus Magasanikbacteria bacterium RIFCSPHIGHO2_12_FULL_41_16]OGH78850.1 MAG: elongation factor Ts [Candidatus Magasanikbacteria bacterium RIFCSPLOWO2_01_FULL_40_15]